METATPLSYLVEQLWSPLLEDKAIRIVEGPSHESSTWRDVERYWLIPDARRARLIVPSGPRPVTSGLLLNYRALREPRTRFVRSVLGAATRCGIPAGRDQLTLQVHRATPSAAAKLPLTIIGEHLGRRVHAAVGVRTGDNRKATLQLVDDDGAPMGYAKVGWNNSTDTALRTEAEALRSVDGGSNLVRSPRLLAQLNYTGHPIVIIEPLPDTVRATARAPTAQELYELCPVVRQDHPCRTDQVRGVRARLAELGQRASVASVAHDAAALLDQLAAIENVHIPVGSRWHGDLAPWNQARDATATLWLWDWETSAADAPAGLDALHWEDSTARLQSNTALPLDELALRSQPYLRAAGVGTADFDVVAAVYAATMVERACTLSHDAGSWDDARQGPAALRELISQARAGLSLR